MAWTALTFSYGAVLTSTQMTQLVANFGYGAGSATPAFQDGTTAITQSNSNNSTKLATTAYADAMYTLGRTYTDNIAVPKDAAAGGVGTIGLMYTGTLVVASNATTAGSNLNWIMVSTTLGIIASTTAPSGTWRNISGDSTGATRYGALFQRIS